MTETREDAARIVGADAFVEPDERDEELLAQRVNELNAVPDPRCGDYVRFTDGRLERISHVHDWSDDMAVQTSEGGSFYLGSGYVSFSGGLNPMFDADELTCTYETKLGSVWFFHHDHFTAHNGVRAEIPFRVYEARGKRRSFEFQGRTVWSDYEAN